MSNGLRLMLYQKCDCQVVVYLMGLGISFCRSYNLKYVEHRWRQINWQRYKNFNGIKTSSFLNQLWLWIWSASSNATQPTRILNNAENHVLTYIEDPSGFTALGWRLCCVKGYSLSSIVYRQRECFTLVTFITEYRIWRGLVTSS